MMMMMMMLMMMMKMMMKLNLLNHSLTLPPAVSLPPHKWTRTRSANLHLIVIMTMMMMIMTMGTGLGNVQDFLKGANVLGNQCPRELIS